MARLLGKVALITRGGSSFGHTNAERFADVTDVSSVVALMPAPDGSARTTGRVLPVDRGVMIR